MPPSAVLDACVLYPVGLRDTLLNVAEAGLFRVLWTDEILAETARNIVEDTPGGTAMNRSHSLIRPDAAVKEKVAHAR